MTPASSLGHAVTLTSSIFRSFLEIDALDVPLLEKVKEMPHFTRGSMIFSVNKPPSALKIACPPWASAMPEMLRVP